MMQFQCGFKKTNNEGGASENGTFYRRCSLFWNSPRNPGVPVRRRATARARPCGLALARPRARLRALAPSLHAHTLAPPRLRARAPRALAHMSFRAPSRTPRALAARPRARAHVVRCAFAGMKRRWDYDTATGLASTDAMVRAETVEMLSSVLADPDKDVRCEALKNLRMFGETTLTLHAGTIVSMLADPDVEVRWAALVTLQSIGDAALSVHAGAILNALTDANQSVRYAAWILTVNYFEQAAVTLHAGAVIGLLSHPVHCVRQETMLTLSKLGDAVLEPHACAIVVGAVALFADPVWEVRKAAVDTILNLDPAAFTLHADAIVGMLADEHLDVRTSVKMAFRYIGHAALTSTTSAIVGLLSSPDRGVHETALKALTYLGVAALASYTGAIAGLITVPVSDARCMAVKSLALAVGAVANVPAQDYSYHMCFVVAETLCDLKRTRVRLDCATMRFKLQMRLVRPYALVWLEYAGKRLCTPGGMWAERDRAAFEKEFI